MEKKNHKFLLVLVVIIILLLCGFIGFYMLDNMGILSNDSVEKISSNTWDVSIKMSDPSIDGNSTITTSDAKKTNINISGKLNANESITYDLKISNSGSIDAYLYNIINSGNDNININYFVNDKEFKKGYVLKSGDTIDVKLKITSNVNDSLNFNLDSQLIFNQYIDQ